MNRGELSRAEDFLGRARVCIEATGDEGAMLYWFKANKVRVKGKNKQPDREFVRFAPIIIDTDSGIGTQFVVEDVNGDKLLDVVVSNKKGVFVIVQERK